MSNENEMLNRWTLEYFHKKKRADSNLNQLLVFP